MYYVYLLQSKINNDIYVGYTDDLKRRFQEHNEGKSQYTRSYRPWILIYYESYRDKHDATKREKELKLHKAKSFLLEHLHCSLMT